MKMWLLQTEIRPFARENRFRRAKKPRFLRKKACQSAVAEHKCLPQALNQRAGDGFYDTPGLVL